MPLLQDPERRPCHHRVWRGPLRKALSLRTAFSTALRALPAMPSEDDLDVIDHAAGLAPGDPLHAARRFRAKVVEASQASHDALLLQPVDGLSPADRLRVAAHVCTLARASSLAQHYHERLDDAPDRDEASSPALP